MKFLLLLHLLVSPYLFAYQDATSCETALSRKQWKPYERAEEYVQALGFKTVRQFREWSQSNERPEDIPSNPNIVYKAQWISWVKFLGAKGLRKKQFRSYESAKQYVQTLGFKTSRQFQEWSRSGERPEDIPSHPRDVYKSEWKSWNEFLGTENVRKKIFRSYESAQALMKKLGIHTYRQFQEWKRSGQRPEDIPSHPRDVYKSEWKSWNEFLGTENVRRKIFRSYESAQALMKKLGIHTYRQFQEWKRSSQRPEDFPSNPRNTYKSEWESWGEFLGTENVHKRNFRSYEAAQALMKELDIHTYEQFQEWSRSGQRPEDFPSDPPRTYKSKWKSWGAFFNKKGFRSYEAAQALMKELGIRTQKQFQEWSRSGERPLDFPSNPHNAYKSEWNGWDEFFSKKSWRSYGAAQVLMQELGIRTQKQFQEWSRSGERPKNIPSHPDRVYKSKWKGWNEFFSKKGWRSYESARILMEQLGIQTVRQFREWSRSKKRPEDFPSNPPNTYKSEWNGWGEFLGPKWMNYSKGQKYVRQMGIGTVKEFLEWLKSSEKPDDFPSNPHIVWNDLWKNTQDFLQIQWVSFEAARAYVQLGEVTSKNEYYKFRESEDLINELPPNPAVVYALYWNGWDDFLWDTELSEEIKLSTDIELPKKIEELLEDIELSEGMAVDFN